jgi:DNA-binding transcriptional ArsR family regulator
MATGVDDELSRLMLALADPSRLAVMQELSTGPYRAGQLAAACGLSAPAMSKHLRVLLRAGLIVDERSANDARVRVFRMRPESLIALQAWLDQLLAHWDEQLASFKRHLEGNP